MSSILTELSGNRMTRNDKMCTRNCLETQLITKAWTDQTFRQLLFQDPQLALQQIGITFGQHTKIQVVEEQGNALTFVLPVQPSNVEGLTDAELENFAQERGFFGTAVEFAVRSA